MITNGDKVIPAGDYTITFSEDIALENLVIMYQPAIEMRAEIKKDGVTVDDPNTLRVGDVIDIEIIPTDPESGDPIRTAVSRRVLHGKSATVWTVRKQILLKERY